MRILMIGAGYVGLCTGVSLASHGHDVTFVERRPDRRDALLQGRLPIVEPGLPDMFEASRHRIRILAEIEASDADLIVIAVGTPVAEGGRSDLSQLESVCNSLRAWPDADVTIRSTLPPGTSIRLPGMLGRPDGSRLSTSPEFLRQGNAMWDVEHPTRIVMGRFPETTSRHVALLEQLFAAVDAPQLTVDVTAAELIKNVSNAFLALKLSFVNEVASLSEEMNVDVDEVLAGIALDPRIGNVYMRPGLGFGGSCLPKELEVVANAGRRRGLPMHIARAAADVNTDQQARFARRILSELGPGAHRLALLGLAFKASTDDLRGSPSMAVARLLGDAGVEIVAHDPAVDPVAVLRELPAVRVEPNPAAAAAGADAIVIGTEWPGYRNLDWRHLRQVVGRPLVFDGRNILDADALVAAGFDYRSIGRPPRDARPAGAPAAVGASVAATGDLAARRFAEPRAGRAPSASGTVR